MNRRSYSVHLSPSNGKFANKFPGIAHIPYILDSRPTYHRSANAYLISRGLGHWGNGPDGRPRSGRIPSQKSMWSYASWLTNFLEWAEVRSIDLQTCDYGTHIAGRYQNEMIRGLWSSTGEGLSANTVNLRVSQACDFLNWMVHTGRRPGSFDVPYKTVRISIDSAAASAGPMTKQVLVREGKARKTSHTLYMPTDSQVEDWLDRVREKKGQTIWLMCYTVLLTAMRREEVVCLRRDTLPLDPNDWQIVNPTAPPNLQNVQITICFGTKGPQYGIQLGDKVGPTRDILIPLALAKLWHEYRNNERAFAFGKLMKGIKGRAERIARANAAAHLFLREDDGRKISGEMLGKAWGSVLSPFGEIQASKTRQQWSPHSGRHWWACSTLWRELKKHDNVSKVTNETALALLENSALSIIRLRIQPQLGHSSKETTMQYLRWIMNMLSSPVHLYEDEAY